MIYIGAGFVEEMRIVAMKLHTKDQAPKEGEQKAAEKPFPKVGVILLAGHQDVMLSSALQRCTHAGATSSRPVRNAPTATLLDTVGADAGGLSQVSGRVEGALQHAGRHRRGSPTP